MIVRKDEFFTVVNHLSCAGIYGFDTETFGLRYQDKFFAVILNDGVQSYYFNFYDGEDCDGERFPDEFVLEKNNKKFLNSIFENEGSIFIAHNALYDVQKLSLDGILIRGRIVDTLACEKVFDNTLNDYSLSAIAKKYGLEKDDAVEKFIEERKLYDYHIDSLTKKKEKIKRFDLVPWRLITKYGERDAELVYKIGMKYIERIRSKEV